MLYRLNREHLAAPAVVALANLWGALIDRLTERLASWPVPPRFAALFGSAARGTSSPGSDLDVFLVQPPDGHLVEAWTASVRLLEEDATRV